MNKFTKHEIKKASKKLRKYVRKGEGLPKAITMINSEGEKVKLSKREYMGLFEQRNVFALNHGRVPNYVILRNTANNPLVLDYQNNGHTCCPTSLSMCIGFLFDYHSEMECAKALGTGDDGTDPYSLTANAPEVGVVAKSIPRTWNKVKKSLSKGRPVIAHIETKPATCLGFKTYDGGHYIVIYDVYRKWGLKYYKVADPTRGLQTCRAKVLNNATKGRDIKYYSIIPK